MSAMLFRDFTYFQVSIEIIHRIKKHKNSENFQLDTMVGEYLQKSNHWCHPENRYESNTTATCPCDKKRKYSPYKSEKPWRPLHSFSCTKYHTTIYYTREQKREEEYSAPREKSIRICKKVALIVCSYIIECRIVIPNKNRRYKKRYIKRQCIRVSKKFVKIFYHKRGFYISFSSIQVPVS